MANDYGDRNRRSASRRDGSQRSYSTRQSDYSTNRTNRPRQASYNRAPHDARGTSSGYGTRTTRGSQAQRPRTRSSYDGRSSSARSLPSALLETALSLPRPVLIGAAVIIILILVFAIRGCGGSAEPEPQQPQAASAAATSEAVTQSGGASASAEKDPATAHLNTAMLGPVVQAGIDFGRRASAGDYSISITTTGDIMFGREVSTFVDEHGGAAALANVADALSAADVTIANLECPLTEDESEALIGKDVLWRSNPKGIDGLKTAGIDVVSLANNHIMDYGGTGLSDTLKALDGAGILHAGAGMTEKDAEKIAELNVNGVSIAFFSWTDIIPDNFMAFGDSPGVVSARLAMDDACKRVREAKKSHDIVIVAMHWGVEYQDYIDSALQEEPAHKLVDAGADVVWGSHPHVIEGIEFYKGSLISYSQGDFVCDHYSQETGESFILDFDMTPDGIENVTATPVYLDDEHGIPSIVTGDEADNILGRLELISEGMNTTFTIENDVAHIEPISAAA